MDKAPDAFRTISEVADDLDIPQHVLRFWETRFAQIKPMKRSGGRRYYRPMTSICCGASAVCLYGEGYTIRGVQRILKEHGIKAVQALADGSAVASFGAVEARSDKVCWKRMTMPFRASTSMTRTVRAPTATIFACSRSTRTDLSPAFDSGPIPGAVPGALDAERLEGVLQDLIACRQLLDSALKDG